MVGTGRGWKFLLANQVMGGGVPCGPPHGYLLHHPSPQSARGAGGGGEGAEPRKERGWEARMGKAEGEERAWGQRELENE